MNLFSPYKIELETSSELHLRESVARRRFLFIFFRVFPILLIVLYGAFASTAEDFDETLQTVLFVSALGLAILFLTRTYVTEVKISRDVIELTSHSFFFTHNRTLLIGDIDKIMVKVQHGRGGGFFFKYKLKTGSSHTLFTIPVMYMKMKNLQPMCDRITGITGLSVETQ